MAKLDEVLDHTELVEKAKPILEEIKARTKRGAKNYYKPLPKDKSAIIREYFKSCISNLDPDGDPDIKLSNVEGTLMLRGYERIVIGDYGAYIECADQQVALENIESRWPGPPRRKVKYIWMQTKDKAKTKVYFQQGRVAYADYKVGMYYIDPLDLYYGE